MSFSVEERDDARVRTPPAQPRLDRALTRGVAWMGVTKWATQLISWAATLIVVGLLTPADFGVLGMATVLMGVMTVLSEFGIDAAVVTMRDMPARVLHQLNTLSVFFGFACALLAAAAAPLMAWFFRTPELNWVVIAMSATFVVSGFRVVPQALLQKHLRFRGLAMAEAGQALLASAVTVLLAWMGFRYWSLVIGGVLGSVAVTALILLQSRCAFAWPRRHESAAALRFSRHTIIARLAWYGYDNADFFIAGRVLGRDALGAYTVAWQLATAVIQRISSLIGRVTPAVLSAAQRDPAALRRYLFAVTETISLFTVPATVGLALVAPALVQLALGEKWASAILPLQLLSLYAAVRSVTPFLSQVLAVTGDMHRLMRINLWGLLLLPPVFLYASRWGVGGIAAAWIVAHPLIIAVPAGAIVFKRLGVRTRDYLAVLVPAASAVAIMGLGVLGVRLLLPASTGPLLGLIVEVLAGAAFYVGALLLLHRARIQRIWRFARSNFSPTPAP
ncbi:MAG TPA: lipopolysaccharide biosynthesis protein [Gemmatimonadaceae bacterium]|nr:lipopolysaccharide biosynthesis protein [Gemmatimonadaceae bacterium]